MVTATIRYPLDERILILFAAEKKILPRAAYTVEQEDDAIVFQVTAHDATALRAALTTITKVLSVWESTALHGQ